MNNKGISEKEIDQFEVKNKIILPKVYKEFLLKNNGFSDEGGLLIYQLGELMEVNTFMAIFENMPGYIAIGDDGGGLVFLMKQKRNSRKVFINYMSAYNLEDCYEVVNDFESWVDGGFFISENKKDSEEFFDGLFNIVMISKPQNGLKDLVRIKKIFNCNISTSELLAKSKMCPFILIEKITYSKAEKLVERFGEDNIFKIEKC